MPGINPMGSSLTEGLNGPARAQSPQAKQIVARSPWDVPALRGHAPKPQFTAARAETVSGKSLTLRDVTFEAEPSPGMPLTLSGTLMMPARAVGDRRLLPALVLIPDRSEQTPGPAARAWAARGYAALALALALPGHGDGNDKGSASGLEWTDEALASVSHSTNPLYSSVAAAIAAVNLLTLQPEVDSRRIGLMGEGWGGTVAALAGSVDERPHALVLVQTAGGLARGSLAEALKKLSAKDRDAWIQAYDPDSYAKADHPATLFVQPLSATEPPLTALMTTFRSRTGVKTLALIPPDAKDGAAATETAWLATRLQDQAALPEIRSLRPDGDGTLVQVDGKLPPQSVAIYYTGGDLATADWKSVPAEKAGDRDWRCSLPKPEDGKPLTLFAALTDARGAIVCSEPGPLTSSQHPSSGKAIASRASR
jgi:dienelactone hydrolase